MPLAISPLGNLIEICTMEITDIKNWREWTIWSVAPLSRIQLVEVRYKVLTCEEKTQYSKEWNGNFVNWEEDQIPDISCPWRPIEGWVMMVATWWISEVDFCGV